MPRPPSRLLFQLGLLTTSIMGSQERGSVKDGSCPFLLVTLGL